jgi:hypothetical protein
MTELTDAMLAEAYDVSVEYIRMARIVNKRRPDLAESVVTGDVSLPKAYALAVEDSRVGLYVKVEPEVKEAVKQVAELLGQTLADFVSTAIRLRITQIFGEDSGDE